MTPILAVDPALLKSISNPWRNRILFELHLRPMSPRQFAHAFGQLDTATIARYFRELKDWDFLEIADELRIGGRRGAAEKVYRAIRRVHFDTKTWAPMPLYLRAECSGIVLSGLVSRMIDAAQARSLDVVADRFISNGGLILDRRSWDELVSYLDATLDWIAALEIDAGYRMASSGERPMSQTVGLLAFRSPQPHVTENRFPSFKVASAVAASGYFLMNPVTAKALSEPWRNRILEELSKGPMSPRSFGDAFGGPDLATTARYFRQLRDWGFIEVVEELRGGHRRGAVEKLYRSVPCLHFDATTWRDLPTSLKGGEMGQHLDDLVYRLEEACEAGTLDVETNRHLSWLVLWLDRQGWQEVLGRLREAKAWVHELCERAATRIERNPADAIPVTAAVLGFRSPEAFPWTEISSLPIGFAPNATACRAAA